MAYSEEKLVIAVQGTKGAYAQIAAQKMFPNAVFLYFKYFEAVAKAVNENLCRYGVLPIENNTYGSVKPVYRILETQSISVVHAVKLEICHQLLAKQGTRFEDIKEIISHEQAIGQCSRYLHSLGDQITVRPVLNTAVAARTVAEEKGNSIAAISSPECAELYGLRTLKRGIADTDSNYTRFLCIAKEPEISPKADHISLILSLPHRPGSLAAILSRFAEAGINLLKIESTPIPGRDFEFLFFIDLAASASDPKAAQILQSLEADCPQYTFLGCYEEE